MAVDLALVGEQVELARIAMTRLADKGYSLSSPEMLEANETFSKLSNQFLALQEQYETYRDELLRNQKTSPALSQKIDERIERGLRAPHSIRKNKKRPMPSKVGVVWGLFLNAL